MPPALATEPDTVASLLARAIEMDDDTIALFEFGPAMLDQGPGARNNLRRWLQDGARTDEERAWAAFFLALFHRGEDLLLMLDVADDPLSSRSLQRMLTCSARNARSPRMERFPCKRELWLEDQGEMDRRHREWMREVVTRWGIFGYWVGDLEKVYDALPTPALKVPPYSETGDLAYGYHLIEPTLGVDATVVPLARGRLERSKWRGEIETLLSAIGIATNDPTILGFQPSEERWILDELPPFWRLRYERWVEERGAWPIERHVVENFRSRGYAIEALEPTREVLGELIRALDDPRPILKANAKWQLNRITGQRFVLDEGFAFELSTGTRWSELMTTHPLQERWQAWYDERFASATSDPPAGPR